ncbi:MAG: oligopeptide transporter, OPT family [Deltaproteobacteria bacterium]|nr:oligopeptide transporter, OPT family [Deltaproteobacteria bacterium]
MESNKRSLPPNAYTVLKEGEKYNPIVSATEKIPEITVRSVVFGVIMAIVFSFACAYSGLKAGQVFEAAIPIAILAVGFSGLFARKSTILENVIIQSIGAASGVVVAGAIFTIPALFMIKGIEPKLYHTFLASLLGGWLGVLFLIPLRKYFCVEQHGHLPFPEATATTEILVSGEAGGKQAKVLITSMLVGGFFDFLVEPVNLWNASLKTTLWEFGKAVHDKTKLVFKLQAQALFLGLGYIIGLKYAAIIVAGSLMAWWVMVPLLGYITQFVNFPILPATKALSELSAQEIFSNFVRPIGIGAIAAAGIISIIKNLKTIGRSFSLGFKEIFQKKEGITTEEEERTQSDLKMKLIILGISMVFVLALVFFSAIAGIKVGIIGTIIAFVVSFLFTTVAALAIATVGTNPVSGMTLVTLIITSIVLVQIGVSGTSGIVIALIIGGFVCTALSVAGGFITDLKIGYWIGSTPKNQQKWKFLGILVSSFFVGLAILIIDKAFGFTLPDGSPNPAVPAPQANVMKSIIVTLMDPSQNIPWMLYGVGIFITIINEMLKVPALAFALGMYLPMELNTPLLIGGLLAHLLKNSDKNDPKISEARFQKGMLIASGLIAGASLFGVFGAIFRTFDWHRFLSIGIPVIEKEITIEGVVKKVFSEGEPLSYYANYGHMIGLLAFIALSLYLYYDAKRAKPDE